MKNIKYIMFIIFCLFLNILFVDASCTNEEIELLKDLTEDIKITYKHKGKVETEEGTYYNLFDVKVKNIENDMYISLNNGSTILTPVDREINEIFNNGKWDFDVYSNKCDEKISTIKVFIPRFNTLSLDPLCEGIDGDDFALCGKYYEYDVDYDNFVARVKHYRVTHKVDEEKKVVEEKNNFELIIGNILNFVVQYWIYLVISFIVILTIIISLVLVKKRKKRGVLE